MPSNLLVAHTENDKIVDRIYRKNPFHTDEERLECLFKLYEQSMEDHHA